MTWNGDSATWRDAGYQEPVGTQILLFKIFWHDGDGFFFKTMQVSRKEDLHLYKDTLKHNIL